MKRTVEKMQVCFDEMCKTKMLFRSEVSGRELWNIYLNSFEEGEDPVFRDPESSVHNCNHCNNFVRRYGNIVAIDSEFNLMTMFDIEANSEYAPSFKAMSEKLRSSKVASVFFETYASLNSLPYESCNKTQAVYQIGTPKNLKQYTQEEYDVFGGGIELDKVYTFNHMSLSLPKAFVSMKPDSIESIVGTYADKKSVFTRTMRELNIDTLNLVKDLINQGSLLDGTSHLASLDEAIKLMKDFNKISQKDQENFLWVSTYNMHERVAKFKNTLMGTLCTELSEGEDLNKACLNWNKRVDPANYQKASAPITKKQIAEARKFVEENGYTESFDRRLATIDDISASEILHISEGDGSIPSVSIFDGVKASSTSRHKRLVLEGVSEVSISDFMKDILPKCTSVEAFVENRHSGNFMTLTTSKVKESKHIFPWDNNYSWTYKGNLTGKSQIKDAVSSQGGKVDGVLRFSIMWAEGPMDDSDLDAHCLEPDKNRISFRNKGSRRTGGKLDIDITSPQSHKRSSKKDVVENITYPSLSKMIDGKYEFMVHQYSHRDSKGFSAEIEFNGETFSYSYDKPLKNRAFVKVATVTLKDGEFSIEHHLPETNTSKEIYGVSTNEFHKVNLVCLSPNHWGENKFGNKHFFFTLAEAKATSNVRGFHNENLNQDLKKHRKVMEVLANTTTIQPEGKQLSGLGFNSTVRDSLIVKVTGNFKRTLKINF